MKSLETYVGVGLRAPHIKTVCKDRPNVGWFEVHSENYFYAGTIACQALQDIRKDYPISLHGVGLSLGSKDLLDYTHLGKLKQLIEWVAPCFVSEHLSWNRSAQHFLPDLFPIPYNDESFEVFAANISRVQDFIQQRLFIENPSSYIEYQSSTEHEAEFLARLAKKTGAGILLDVNNVYVSCINHGWDPKAYLNAIPKELVKEIHLAGHSEKVLASGQRILIDTHDHCVAEPVWALYEDVITMMGPIPTLIEWDAQIPEWQTLAEEHDKAVACLVPKKDKQYA